MSRGSCEFTLPCEFYGAVSSKKGTSVCLLRAVTGLARRRHRRRVKSRRKSGRRLMSFGWCRLEPTRYNKSLGSFQGCPGHLYTALGRVPCCATRNPQTNACMAHSLSCQCNIVPCKERISIEDLQIALPNKCGGYLQTSSSVARIWMQGELKLGSGEGCFLAREGIWGGVYAPSSEHFGIFVCVKMKCFGAL